MIRVGKIRNHVRLENVRDAEPPWGLGTGVGSAKRGVSPPQLRIPHEAHPVPAATERLLTVTEVEVGIPTLNIAANSSVEDAIRANSCQLPLKADSVIAVLAITLVVSCRSSWGVREVARGKSAGVHAPVQYRNTRSGPIERFHDRLMKLDTTLIPEERSRRARAAHGTASPAEDQVGTSLTRP